MVLFLLVIGGSLITFLVPALFSGGRFPAHRVVSLSDPGNLDPVTTGHARIDGPHAPLRIALAPVISPERTLVTYRRLVDYLSRRIGRDAIVLQRGTYGETNELVRTGRCDIAFVCTYAFVRGEHEFGMELLAAPRVRGRMTYNSHIIVPASSTAESLLDLRGRRFASADMLSNTGWIYPSLWLREHDLDPLHFFGEHVISGSHDRSVAAVQSGQVDGAAVDSLVYEDLASSEARLLTTIRVIQTSPPYGIPPLVCPKSLDRTLKSRLQTVLLDMGADAEGRQVLAAIGFDGFVIPDTSLYDSVRRAAAHARFSR